jgi:hypothetical protein
MRAVARILRSPVLSANAATATALGAIDRALEHVPTDPQLFVNEARTVLVRSWASGRVEVALRSHTHDLWGAPVELELERWPA